MLTFRIINPQSRNLSEKLNPEVGISEMGVMIRPMPNMTTTAFIAGPKVFIRELHIPFKLLNTWLRKYHSKIDKSARKAMKQNPPSEQVRTMYLSLREFYTKSWRTIFIRTDANPSPVVVVWSSTYDNCAGAWSVTELPNATSVISGGIGSFPVHLL